ncbi:uncharacterized protein Z518_07414 [Rhinocladiella mackenziei CBS 650.93]|uniref:FAD/NAD(P)-binding domain-containing protein n=1 Tax=Rhinocladiella mackenziei CBS 650.93 TaxID=1442369 RepID=A0A0D2IKY4_9EURO|nr:uncharacterized protein Z518_07414 [Rhinocladiella mackenziei CBS 650.93]KIX03861.1 hypothetical protein Z518_07414 [Rhinocladiella mackenziei CBS 650.93]
MLDKLRLVLKLIGLTFSLTFVRISFHISGQIHRLTYKTDTNPKNVVVVGGSFAGYFLAKQLSESLPSGYRVILIEKHSHFHFTWNFPRISVVPDHDHEAFIPFPSRPKLAPEGAYLFQQGNVVAIAPRKVTLEDGSSIDFDYLAIATGSQARYPAKFEADGKSEGIKFFQEQQDRIKAGQNIVIVGGGAAGVEVAGDIKTKYPEKSVTLVHSRKNLLNNFGVGLHETAQKALEALEVKLYLGERVISDMDTESPKEITLSSGTILRCDTLIKCTGQYPRATLIRGFSPASVSQSGGILVDGMLRLKNSPSPNIFALGDVIDTPGPKMGRAATMQGMCVADNIVRAIKQKPLKTYSPTFVDTSIELTLGLGKNVMYINDGKSEISFSKKMTDESMHAAQMWKLMDAQPFHDAGDLEASKLSA